MMKAVATRSSFRDACFCVFVLLILVCAATIPALAQSTASLTGIVTDASGAAVPNAKVTVTNKATGVSFNTQTDSAGAYLERSRALAVAVGDIRVEANAISELAGVRESRADVDGARQHVGHDRRAPVAAGSAGPRSTEAEHCEPPRAA